MSDQIQRDDGEWQMLLNNAYSMVDSLTNRVEARDAQVESLQRENEELKAKLSDWEISPRGSQEIISIQADRIAELETRAITPEMREILQRAFALAREVEEAELAEDLCGLLIETDPYRDPT